MALPTHIIELWIEYTIGVCVCVLRLFARIYVLGWRDLYYDDFFALFAMGFWSSETATIYVYSKHGTFVGLTNKTANALTDVQVNSLTIGSKARFCAWISYICLIWSFKASALFFYNRLARGLKEQRWVKVLGWCVGISWVTMIMEILLQCQPIYKNWQIKPYVGDSCALPYVRFYLLLVLNVSTDIGLMVLIPAPLLWKAQIPTKRKLMVALLLFSSVFIVAAAVIRCVMSIIDIRSTTASGVWAVRETFVAVFAVNLPAIKPLFSCRRRRRAVASSSSGRDAASRKMTSRHTPHEADEVELRSCARWSGEVRCGARDDVERGSFGDEDPSEPEGNGLEIEVTKAFAMSSEERLGSLEGGGPRSWIRAEQ